VGALGGIEDGAGGILAGDPAVVAGARHRIDIGAGGVRGDVHVRKLRLDQLKPPDRLAELLALMPHRG